MTLKGEKSGGGSGGSDRPEKLRLSLNLIVVAADGVNLQLRLAVCSCMIDSGVGRRRRRREQKRPLKPPRAALACWRPKLRSITAGRQLEGGARVHIPCTWNVSHLPKKRFCSDSQSERVLAGVPAGSRAEKNRNT